MFNAGKIFIIVIVGVMLISLSGCVTQSDIEYLKLKDNKTITFTEAEIEDYKLKPNDELYIQITSLDEAVSNVFSNSGGAQNFIGLQPYGASLTSYAINKDGYLILPLIGSLLVKDKTLKQVSEMLKDSLMNILSQPNVTVKLVNRYISVLGEVRNPGHFSYSQEKLNIFDALGLAGDMTIYSNRKQVILSRNENGKNTLIELDLTKPEILESNYYNLRPNDMVYVKPMRKRVWGMSQFPFALGQTT